MMIGKAQPAAQAAAAKTRMAGALAVMAALAAVATPVVVLSANAGPATAGHSNSGMVPQLAKSLSEPSSPAAKAFAERLAGFLAKQDSLGISIPEGRVLAKRWLKSHSSLRARYGKAAELYIIIGDRASAVGWAAPRLRKRLIQAPQLPSYDEFNGQLAKNQFVKDVEKESSRGPANSKKKDSAREYQIFGFLNQSAEIAHRVLWGGRQKLHPQAASALSLGSRVAQNLQSKAQIFGAGGGAAPVSCPGGARCPGHQPGPGHKPEPPAPPPLNASAGFDAEALYGDQGDLNKNGAIVTTVKGQKLSIKMYSRLDPFSNQMVNEIGVFNITDKDNIYGQRFPAVGPQDWKVYLTPPSSSSTRPNVPLHISADGKITLGSLSTSRDELLALRKAQVEASGQLNVINGQYFKIIGQGGAMGSLLYFACDKDGKLKNDGTHPDLAAVVNTVTPDGQQSNLPDPIHLGFVGNNEEGRPQYWDLRWNPDLQSFVAAKGHAPAPPNGSTTTVTTPPQDAETDADTGDEVADASLVKRHRKNRKDGQIRMLTPDGVPATADSADAQMLSLATQAGSTMAPTIKKRSPSRGGVHILDQVCRVQRFESTPNGNFCYYQCPDGSPPKPSPQPGVHNMSECPAELVFH